MISIFLASEESRRMLVAFLVAIVAIGVGELGVAGLLSVGVVADGQISPCSEGRAEVDRIEDGTLLVDEAHLLLEGK